MKKMMILVILLTACRTKEKPVLTCDRVTTYTTKVGRVLGPCSCWTKDTMLCSPSETSLLWCQAKGDGSKPSCEVSLDWTPQKPRSDAQTPPGQQPPTQPPTP